MVWKVTLLFFIWVFVHYLVIRGLLFDFIKNPTAQCVIALVSGAVFFIWLIKLIVSGIKAKREKSKWNNRFNAYRPEPAKPDSANNRAPKKWKFPKFPMKPLSVLRVAAGIVFVSLVYFYWGSIASFLSAMWGRIVFALVASALLAVGVVYASVFKNATEEISVFEWHIPFFRSPRSSNRIAVRFFEQGYGARVYGAGVHFSFLWKLFAKVHKKPLSDFFVHEGKVGVVIALDGQKRSSK
ncbi:MAG: hypothetical protein HYW88_00615, partial [Candidatus Sungbacteria bacterium]|nr:hypothetical protein [Candidatus Sungbacteria bacterium]